MLRGYQSSHTFAIEPLSQEHCEKSNVYTKKILKYLSLADLPHENIEYVQVIDGDYSPIFRPGFYYAYQSGSALMMNRRWSYIKFIAQSLAMQLKKELIIFCPLQ